MFESIFKEYADARFSHKIIKNTIWYPLDDAKWVEAARR